MSERCYNCFREKEKAGPCPHCGWDDAKAESFFPPPLKPGSILNGLYVVGRVLRRDSTSVSYLAQDYQSGVRVAVKEYLPEDLVRRAEPSGAVCLAPGARAEVFSAGRERFLREVKNLAAFRDDPCFVRIIRYFEENGTVYFVTEYEEGPTLEEYVTRRGRLSPRAAGELLLPIMDALERVHAAGMVERNVAPDNIQISLDGKGKLMDFGAGPLPAGEESMSLVKHGFAAKEQYTRSGRLGAYTDVYALGATLYYALTGVVPQDSIERADVDELADPAEYGVKLSTAMEDVLQKALALEPQDRYPNMRVFCRELEQALQLAPREHPRPVGRAAAEPEPIRATTAVGQRPARRRGVLPLILVLLAAAALIAFFAVRHFSLNREPLPSVESAEPSDVPETEAPAEPGDESETDVPAEPGDESEMEAPAEPGAETGTEDVTEAGAEPEEEPSPEPTPRPKLVYRADDGEDEEEDEETPEAPADPDAIPEDGADAAPGEDPDTVEEEDPDAAEEEPGSDPSPEPTEGADAEEDGEDEKPHPRPKLKHT